MLREHMALLRSAGTHWFRCYKYRAALRPGHFSPNNIIPHPSSLRLIPTKEIYYEYIEKLSCGGLR